MKTIFDKECIYTPLYSTYKGTSSIPCTAARGSELSTSCAIVGRIMRKNLLHGSITLGILATLLVGGNILYVYSPVIQKKVQDLSVPDAREKERIAYPYEGDHVVVFLDTMRIELRNGTTTLENIGIVSIGKPGSYYETVGGAYANDYKIKRHFSSIGEVYLPWSVHVFGNFFIHGIPYYRNGNKVSSTYSGGCIRLTDEDAERVYDFVSVETPIVIVQQDMEEFFPTSTSTDTFASMEATRYMAVIVSLEVLKQDEKIKDADGTDTTRRKLIPRLLNDKDDAVIAELARSLGDEVFLDYMNKKAAALGLTNTVFGSVDEAGMTTADDYMRLMLYVADYKSYLVNLATSTTELSR